MTLKPRKIFGPFKVTSIIVITMNLEFNSMCRKKKHSLFHWSTLSDQGCLHKSVVLQGKRIDDSWNVDGRSKFVRFMGRIHEVHFIERKTSQMISVVHGETDENSRDYQT